MRTGDDELIEISGWTDDDAGVLYAASVLDELSLIELVERLNELNQNKMLSIGAGEASNLLHEFWDQGYRRMPAKRRAAIFAHVFGADSDDAFAGLLEALATALADGADAAPAAAALRDELTARADDTTARAAGELRGVLGAIATVLSDMELRSAYRAGDMWQVVENVQQEFGGAVDVRGTRTRAFAGALMLHRLPELCAGDVADDELVTAAGHWLPANHPAA
ncbi:MAG TPA: hypothetical protein VGO80_01275 [Solirubrobacteraceae bacterium]|nr:hypothetical protein [Solirubrobacteraceae bacterium]